MSIGNHMQKTKHRRIHEYMHQQIIEGGYKAGERLPTDAQLMEQFEASRPTVARAMQDLERAGLLERRPGSGSYVRLPSTVENRLLGLLIPGLGETEIFEPICGQIARTSQNNNFGLLWGDSSADIDDQAERAKQLCRQYIEQKVTGVFFAPIELTPGSEEINLNIADALRRAGIAVVLLDRDIVPYPRRSQFDLVGINNFQAGYLQASHLISKGCRRINYISRPYSAPTVGARIEGCRLALSEHGLTLAEVDVKRGDPTDEAFFNEIKSNLPDGFACANDITAATLMQRLLETGVKIPDDVRVIGLDDVKYSHLFSVPLTTLNQPCRAIGSAAVETMMRRLENQNMPARDVLLNTVLVERKSG